MFKQVRLHDAILKFYQRSQPIAFSNAETLYDDLVLLRDQILMYGDLSEAQTNYLNSFIDGFDTTLSTTVRDIFNKWFIDGFLVDFIRDIINEEVIDSRDGEASLSVRLNRDRQVSETKMNLLQENTEDIIAQVNTQLGELGGTSTFKGSATNADILDKIDMQVGDEWFDTTNHVSLRWNGTSWVSVGGTIKIGQKTVSEDKTTFFKFGKNLFNYKDITVGHVVSNITGEILANATFNAFQFIPVEPNTTYIKSAGYSYAFYQNKSVASFISGGGSTGNEFTTPPNANFVSISTHVDADLKSYMVVKGTELGTYEPYIERHIPINKIGELEDKSVGEDKMTFIEESFNLYDAKSVEKGCYYTWNTGEKVVHSDYTASEPMDTPPGSYQNNRQIRFVAFYNNSGDHIGGIDNLAKDAGFTVPQNATKTIVSMANLPANDLQITKGSTVQPFKVYGSRLNHDVVPSLITPTAINLPDIMYVALGTTLDIYFDNIIFGKASDYDFSVTSTIGKTMSDRWTYSPTTAGLSMVDIEVYQNGVFTAKKRLSIIATDIATNNLTALVLGDSTVNANFMTQRLLDLYSQEPSTLTLIGTRGSGENRSEGRGGWGARTYRTGATIYGDVNPFYNPVISDFDFAYYMSNQGYNTPVHVIIQLGINDNFGAKSDDEVYAGLDQIKTDLDFIINSIKEYSPSIKVGISVTIPPNSDQDVFGEAYGNAQVQWRYKRNNAIWTRWLIDTYQYRDSENIRLIPMHHNIDTSNDFRDAVHPKDSVDFGYGRMGDSVYSYLKRIG